MSEQALQALGAAAAARGPATMPTTESAVELAAEPMSEPDAWVASEPTSGPIVPPSLASQPASQSITAAAEIVLTPADTRGGGPLEIAPERAIRLALAHRVDLSVLQGRVFDAQRKVAVAANALQAGLNLQGNATIGEHRNLGSATEASAQLDPRFGNYDVGLSLDLPLERTAERNAYRESYINLQQAVRSVQELEDQIKQQIRDELRTLLQAREGFRIQDEAVRLANRRVRSTELFVQAGRAQIRDVLDARAALLSAQNDRTSALVEYRVAALDLQRDMDVLTIDERGLWSEYQPDQNQE
jgi:outer membrane protein TolC